MKRIKYLITSFAAASLFFGVSSCDTIETDLTQDPSQLAPNQASLKLYFNSLQVSTANIFEQASAIGMDATRMTHMSGSSNYQNNFTPTSFDAIWNSSYATFLADSKALKELAAEKGHPRYQAVAKILEANVLVTLVDFFGDIPYSEALNGLGNLNPGRDDDAAVYAAAETLLNEAKVQLNQPSASIENDLYYGGNMPNWARLANSLLLKIAVQTRLVDTNAQAKIQAILTANNYITNNTQNFVFRWSSTATNPDSRHPRFVESYATGTPTEYLGNYFMYMVTGSKPTGTDPRGSFYFYRKTLNNPSSNTESGCFNNVTNPPAHYAAGIAAGDYTYCFAGNGYNGKDHGDASPAPNDGAIVTIMGQYPAGGLRDTGAPATISATSGQGGAGISPMITASYVHFLIAEAQLTVFNNAANAKTSMLTAIDANMEAVTTTPNAAYNTYVGTQYDNAASTAAKLNVLMTEFYLSLWGNGVEAYNNFRRTGLPQMQPSLSPSPGSFVNLMFYPATHVNLNTSVSQRPSVSEKVFWAAPTTFNLDY